MFAISKFVGLSCAVLAFIVTLNGCQSTTGKTSGQTVSGKRASESPAGRGTSSTEDYLKSPPCEINTGEAALKAEQNQAEHSHMIRGEVMQVKGSNYVVKEREGKQVSLKTEETTAQPVIQQGQHIEASVNEENRLLWIRTDISTDRRNEHAASDCVPN